MIVALFVPTLDLIPERAYIKNDSLVIIVLYTFRRYAPIMNTIHFEQSWRDTKEIRQLQSISDDNGSISDDNEVIDDMFGIN